MHVMPFSDLLERREMQRKELEAEALAAVEECCRRFAREFPCGRIWVFGSLARGCFHRQSDINIAVEGLPEELFFKAHAFLMRCLPAGHEIDLTPFESLVPAVRQRVETEGKLLVG
jgi:predicted nucleotidyltransferase